MHLALRSLEFAQLSLLELLPLLNAYQASVEELLDKRKISYSFGMQSTVCVNVVQTASLKDACYR